jgi:hypothetical protein
VLEACEEVHPDNDEACLTLRLDVPGVFRLPSAPAKEAAARAALAGVTRLGMLGDMLDPSQLAAALLHLPGLRAVSLACGDCIADPELFGLGLVDALAACPWLESLEWEPEGPPQSGAQGSGLAIVHGMMRGGK